MGYRKISNLYKNREILLFKQAYALEKIHGTSAHVKYLGKKDELRFFSGGANHENFINLFNEEDLLSKFSTNKLEHGNDENITIYGEAYGGKLQGMSHTYGKELRFIAFEVLIGEDNWLDVIRANRFVEKLELEFVHYDLIDISEDNINTAMMADSVQAVRNGMGAGHMREGIVLRPTVELYHFNGGRIIAKHKRPEFAEREHTPRLIDPEKLKVLEDAKDIADEWCVYHRLEHVLQSFPEDVNMESMAKIIKAMISDIYIEAKGEIVESKAVAKAIGKKTVKLFREWLNKRG